MREHSVLRRLVVIRRDDERGVCAEFARAPGEINRRGSVVAARSGNDFCFFLVRDFDCQFDYTQSFRLGHRNAFAGRAARNQQLDAAFYLSLDELPKTLVVNRAVFFKRSYQRSSAAAHPINSHRHMFSPKENLSTDEHRLTQMANDFLICCGRERENF